MELDELMLVIQKIKILSNTISKQKFSGANNSLFKGRGLTFDSVRKYEIGDDIRDINWNVTAKFRETYINTFQEDKQSLIWLLIDVSGSLEFGTGKYNKWEIEQILSATIAYSSIKNNNAVGVIFFSNKIEGYIRPAKGLAVFSQIIRKIVNIKPSGQPTNICPAFELLMSSGSKSSLVFILSDFITNNYKSYTKLISQKHELIAVRVYDKIETFLPNMGWVYFNDSEFIASKWVNTSSKSVKADILKNQQNGEKYFNDVFSGKGLYSLNVCTTDKPIEKILTFMYNRS
jgi:uncharacterized protein (DUF58 family)